MEEVFLEQTRGRENGLIVCTYAEAILGIGDQGVGVAYLCDLPVTCDSHFNPKGVPSSAIYDTSQSLETPSSPEFSSQTKPSFLLHWARMPNIIGSWVGPNTFEQAFLNIPSRNQLQNW